MNLRVKEGSLLGRLEKNSAVIPTSEKIQKRMESGRQSCPLSRSCFGWKAGGRVEDVSVITPRGGGQCDHPHFVSCPLVMDLAIASSYIQAMFALPRRSL